MTSLMSEVPSAFASPLTTTASGCKSIGAVFLGISSQIHSSCSSRPQRYSFPSGVVHERQPSPRVDVPNGGGRILRVLSGGVLVGGIHDVDEVMPDPAPLVDGHLVRADVEPAVDGRRIAVDDFAVVPPGQRESQRAFPGRRRAEYGDDDRIRH